MFKPQNLSEDMILGLTVEEKFLISELKTTTLITILLIEESGNLEIFITKAYVNNKITKKIMHVLTSGDRNIFFKQINGYQISLADYKIKNDRLYYLNRLWVLDNNDLKLTILNAHYKTPAAGHPGYKKMYKLIQRNYY
jgi:hypothetical protein